MIEENPLADCTHACTQVERKNYKYNIRQHMVNPFMSFYSRSGTEWDSFLRVIVGSVETTLVGNGWNTKCSVTNYIFDIHEIN